MVATPQYYDPARRVLASAPDNQMPLWGLELSHPMFEETHYIINRPYPMNLTHEDDLVYSYLPMWFEIVLPKMDGQGQQDVSITLQNVDRMIVDELERANTDPTHRIDVVLRLFLEDDLTAGPQNVPLRLTLASVAATSQSVTGTAGRFDVLNKVFPAEIYRITRWPGLDR